MRSVAEHRGYLEGLIEARKEVLEVLPMVLKTWLRWIDNDIPVEWTKHVVEKDFICGCIMEFEADEEMVVFLYCDDWKSVKDLIHSKVVAEIEAHRQKDLLWYSMLVDAYEINRHYDHMRPIYLDARKPGETFPNFLRRILP
jgi:hypothetical protein